MPRIDAAGRRAEWIGPDLPGGLRAAQALEEPGFLLRAEDRLRGFVRAIVGDALVAEGQLRRRMAVGVGAAGVELRPQFLRHEAERVVRERRVDLVVAA